MIVMDADVIAAARRLESLMDALDPIAELIGRRARRRPMNPGEAEQHNQGEEDRVSHGQAIFHGPAPSVQSSTLRLAFQGSAAYWILVP